MTVCVRMEWEGTLEVEDVYGGGGGGGVQCEGVGESEAEC